MKSLKNLEIYQLSFQLSVDIYFLSLKLPNSEKYEPGSQISRSSQSINELETRLNHFINYVEKK